MLWAVHISEGILAAPWWLGGYGVAAALLWLAARRLHEDEVPRIALLTAAVFISSSIHVRLGPTTVHLLLSGLVGVLLGRRAALAVAVGLVMQALLLGHGGTQTIGVNTCVITLPALLCGAVYNALHRRPALKRGPGRAALVAVSGGLLFLSGAYLVRLAGERLQAGWLTPLSGETYRHIALTVAHPSVLLGTALFALFAVRAERRLENDPEFPLGLLLGVSAVLLTVGLNALVLTFGAEENCDVPALLLVLAHLPIAVIEGVVLGFAVGFLTRVKPELLAVPVVVDVPDEEPAVAAER